MRAHAAGAARHILCARGLPDTLSLYPCIWKATRRGLPEVSPSGLVREEMFLAVKELRCGSGLSRPGCITWRGGLGTRNTFLGLPSFPACSCGRSPGPGGEGSGLRLLPLNRTAALSSPMRRRASSCPSRRRSLATALAWERPCCISASSVRGSIARGGGALCRRASSASSRLARAARIRR